MEGVANYLQIKYIIENNDVYLIVVLASLKPSHIFSPFFNLGKRHLPFWKPSSCLIFWRFSPLKFLKVAYFFLGKKEVTLHQ